MSARHVMPVLTAGAATGVVLLLRWAATRGRPDDRWRGAGAARRPWRRTPGSGRRTSRGAGARAHPVVEEAEEHVYRYWERLRRQVPPGG